MVVIHTEHVGEIQVQLVVTTCIVDQEFESIGLVLVLLWKGDVELKLEWNRGFGVKLILVGGASVLGA